MAPSRNFPKISKRLCEIGRDFYQKGWVPATGGNFSALISRSPLKLAITPSKLHKGNIPPEKIVQVNGLGNPQGKARASPSEETLIHLAIVEAKNAGAVLHTHSVWNTLLSRKHAKAGGFYIEGYEMLKCFRGVASHRHSEWIPIIENSQDLPSFAKRVKELLGNHPDCHGFLVDRHGLYAWGENLDEAQRHVEAFEFLFEVLGRQ